MGEKETALIMGNSNMQENGNRAISDVVMVEIVHAFKEIIIEYIDRKFKKNALHGEGTRNLED